MDNPVNLTDLIHRAGSGDAEAADRLFAATYADLRKLAPPHDLATGCIRVTSTLLFNSGSMM